MIHVPVLFTLKVASVIYRNREAIAQGVRDFWDTSPALDGDEHDDETDVTDRQQRGVGTAERT